MNTESKSKTIFICSTFVCGAATLLLFSPSFAQPKSDRLSMLSERELARELTEIDSIPFLHAEIVLDESGEDEVQDLTFSRSHSFEYLKGRRIICEVESDDTKKVLGIVRSLQIVPGDDFTEGAGVEIRISSNDQIRFAAAFPNVPPSGLSKSGRVNAYIGGKTAEIDARPIAKLFEYAQRKLQEKKCRLVGS